MSWDDYARRRAAITASLEYAATNAGTGFEQLESVRAEFATERELLLALQYEWRRALAARIELIFVEIGEDTVVDAALLSEQAWIECAQLHPVLRRVLEEHRDLLAPRLPARSHVA